MFRYTQSKLMSLVAIVFAIYSLLWSLAPFDQINLPARLILDISNWPLNDYSKPFDKNTKFLSSIGAGLLFAISVFLYGIVVPAIKEWNKRVIRTTICAMTYWYIIDGIGSIASGVSSNVFFNSIYLALVLLPLLLHDRTEP